MLEIDEPIRIVGVTDNIRSAAEWLSRNRIPDIILVNKDMLSCLGKTGMLHSTDPGTGLNTSSKMVRALSDCIAGFSLYPVSFDNKFILTSGAGTKPARILLTSG